MPIRPRRSRAPLPPPSASEPSSPEAPDAANSDTVAIGRRRTRASAMAARAEAETGSRKSATAASDTDVAEDVPAIPSDVDGGDQSGVTEADSDKTYPCPKGSLSVSVSIPAGSDTMTNETHESAVNLGRAHSKPCPVEREGTLTAPGSEMHQEGAGGLKADPDEIPTRLVGESLAKSGPVPPPRVTKATRRETLKSVRQNPRVGKDPSGDHLHSLQPSISSVEDEEMMNVFSPPPSRTRKGPSIAVSQPIAPKPNAEISGRTSKTPSPTEQKKMREVRQSQKVQPLIQGDNKNEDDSMEDFRNLKIDYTGNPAVRQAATSPTQMPRSPQPSPRHRHSSSGGRRLGAQSDEEARRGRSEAFAPPFVSLAEGINFEGGEGEAHEALKLSFDPGDSHPEIGRIDYAQPKGGDNKSGRESSASVPRRKLASIHLDAPHVTDSQQLGRPEISEMIGGENEDKRENENQVSSSRRMQPTSEVYPHEKYAHPQQHAPHSAYPYPPAYYPPPPEYAYSHSAAAYAHYHAAGSPPQVHTPYETGGGAGGGYPPHYAQWVPPHGPHPGYYVYPSPHHVPHHQYQMQQPSQPTIGDRKETKKRDRDDGSQVVKSAGVRHRNVGGPGSRPSPKKLKGSDALMTWESPPREMVDPPSADDNTPPQQGSSNLFCARRETTPDKRKASPLAYAARTPNASIEENLTFGATPTPGRGILPSDSWTSPMGAIGTLFEDDEIHPEDRTDAASFRTTLQTDGENQEPGFEKRVSRARGTARERSPTIPKNTSHPSFGLGKGKKLPFGSAIKGASPPPGPTGITIRGSPISTKADRGVGRPHHSRSHVSRTSAHSSVAPGSTPSLMSVSSESGSHQKLGERQTWTTPAAKGPGAFRIKIGRVGMETADARRGMEDINSVLRGSPLSSQRQEGLERESMPPPSALSSQQRQTPMRYGVPSTPYFAPCPTGQPPFTSSREITPSSRKGTGKENTENSATKSNPCNCKKSKCLKLYCECFAAERYCGGCKCVGCQNTPSFEDIRHKAIQDTKAKNPQAFKPRITSKPGVTGTPSSPPTAHTTGCRCRKSACLKKYCECFEGGIVCGKKCKCVDCQNFVGSQALIDRRRKIKDVKGAELAMRSSDEAWKGSQSETRSGLMQRNTPTGYDQSPIVHDPRAGRIPYHSMMMMSPMPHPGASPHLAHPYRHPHVMMGQSPIGYPPQVIVQPTPYSPARQELQTVSSRAIASPSRKERSYQNQYATSTPRGRAIRRGYDPQLSEKSAGKPEAKEAFFGSWVQKQSRTTALTIFSFLSNDDIYNASLVSKNWSYLAFDKELWQQP